MLASRILPPIIPRSAPPPPVATFINIPRRYVKSNMQVGNDALDTKTDDARPPRHLRKSSRASDSHLTSTSSPTGRLSKEWQDPPALSPSGRVTRKKRTASSEDGINVVDYNDENSPVDSRAPPSASSTGSGELSGQVCLCQPEPKIPRPRNGKSDQLFLYFRCGYTRTARVTSNKEKSLLFADIYSTAADSL